MTKCVATAVIRISGSSGRSCETPVGAGFVETLARPGGNAIGFMLYEYGISGKWLELLKEIAPPMTRAAVLRDPALAAGIGQFAAIQSNASSSAVELSAIDTRDVGEIERAVVAFARKPNGGLIVTASASALIHRDQIIALATRLRLPNVYPFRYYPSYGGLASGRNRQRRFPGTTLMMHGAPALVLAQHLGRNLRFKGSPVRDRPCSSILRHQCRARQVQSMRVRFLGS
jgi:hypothetical protein